MENERKKKMELTNCFLERSLLVMNFLVLIVTALSAMAKQKSSFFLEAVNSGSTVGFETVAAAAADQGKRIKGAKKPCFYSIRVSMGWWL